MENLLHYVILQLQSQFGRSMKDEPYSMCGFNNRKNWLLLIGVIIVSAFLNFYGLGLGLPSQERLELALGGSKAVEKKLPELKNAMASNIAEQSEFLDKKNPDNFRELAKLSPYFDQVRTFNPDEFYVFKVLAQMYQEKDPRPNSYIYGSFFFYQMGFPLAIAKITGYLGAVGSPESYLVNPEKMRPFYFSVRMLCALFQTLAVAALFLTGWRIAGPFLAFFSSLLMATLPLITVGAKFIKPDPPVLFWSVLTLLFAVPILKRVRWFDYIASGICAGLAAATKYPAVFTFSYILMFHLLRRYEECKSWRALRFSSQDRYLAGALASSVIAGILSSLPILFNFSVFAQSVNYHMNTSRQGNLLYNFLDTVLNYAHDAFFLTYGIPAAIAIAAGTVIALIIKPRKIWWGMLPIVIFFFYSAAKGMPTSDMYTLPAVPVLCLFAGYALDLLKKPMLKTLICAVILIGTFSYSLAYLQCIDKENARLTAARWINKNLPEQSSIGSVFYPVSYRMPMVSPEKYHFLSRELVGSKVYEADYFINSYFTTENQPFLTRITSGENLAPPPEYKYQLIKEFEVVPRAFFGLLPLERRYRINFYFEIIRPKIAIYRKNILEKS